MYPKTLSTYLLQLIIELQITIYFPGLNYAVFGLGNKTYEHYNAMGIYVDKRLEELGGKRIHDLGMRTSDLRK